MIWKALAAALVGASIALSSPALATDTVKVGVTTTGVPFTFVDTASQKPTGAMVDIAKAIAEDNDIEPDFKVTAFSALIPALQTGKIDMISAGMFATEKRMKVVSFSEPVYSYGEAMFVAADDRKDYSLDDLKGATVGAQVGTTFADSLRKLGTFGEVKLYDSIADIMRDVKLGRLKAGFGDQPIVAYEIKSKPNLGVRLVKGYKPMNSGNVALAVAKDNQAFLDKVNASIEKLKKSGKLDEIFAKYGL